ncbi:N-acetylmuramoyl-L-alanine amidase [Cognatishimia sp. MH4019]|uniref:N-acetylmuramoyl-L-alanine amidase n=1 Tax=Cognatishimia sp. MH4019 TaxID=2854030 RepID=UPI001CD2461F|nr:N-acetylmuramoyl-L-alanine amidase [Cognatishimia sp. MH4019]
MIRIIAILGVLFCAQAAIAQGFGGLARVDVAQSQVKDRGGDVLVELHLSQAVPYRVFTVDDPPRLVMDFREVLFDGMRNEVFLNSDGVSEARFGPFRPGWSRMVLDLTGPLAVFEAGMIVSQEDASGVLNVRLRETSSEAFAEQAGAATTPEWALQPDLPEKPLAKQRQQGDRAVIVLLDPGHGGIDPGAERNGVSEAVLMLTFARELKEALLRAGNFDVRLTRDENVFVSLETRVAMAHRVQADVFISLHADTVAEGVATGATVYTLADEASDAASAQLAERHDRSDLLAGIDLTRQGDEIATILMDLARLETAPRTDRLADTLVRELRNAVGEINNRPRRQAAFSVLKAPDIPSVLVELGFMSSPSDFENLIDPEWRAQAASGIAAALVDWVVADAAEARLIRQ